jgi:hypothetical protein
MATAMGRSAALPGLEAVQRNWGWFVALGIVEIITG